MLRSNAGGSVEDEESPETIIARLERELVALPNVTILRRTEAFSVFEHTARAHQVDIVDGKLSGRVIAIDAGQIADVSSIYQVPLNLEAEGLAEAARQRAQQVRQTTRSARVDLIEVSTKGGHLEAVLAFRRRGAAKNDRHDLPAAVTVDDSRCHTGSASARADPGWAGKIIVPLACL